MNNQDFFEKYLQKYVWSGDLYIDGGWGDKQKVITTLCKYTVNILEKVVAEGYEEALFLSSPVTDQVPIHNPSSGIPGLRPANTRYCVSFINNTFKDFSNVVETIDSLSTTSFHLVLKSSTVEDGVLKDGNIRLIVSMDKENGVVYRVVEGRPVIVFDRPKVVAEWLESNNISEASNG